MDSELHNILFIYDTFTHNQQRQRFLSAEKSRFIGKAATAGELYTIGDFPALSIETAQTAGYTLNVHGDLFEIFDPVTFFATLDIIEGCWLEQTERSLFVRRLIPVQTETDTIDAWAYILNLPINGLPRFQPPAI